MPKVILIPLLGAGVLCLAMGVLLGPGHDRVLYETVGLMGAQSPWATGRVCSIAERFLALLGVERGSGAYCLIYLAAVRLTGFVASKPLLYTIWFAAVFYLVLAVRRNSLYYHNYSVTLYFIEGVFSMVLAVLFALLPALLVQCVTLSPELYYGYFLMVTVCLAARAACLGMAGTL